MILASIWYVSRWTLCAILVFSGAPKLFDLPGFASRVADYEILPAGLVRFVSLALPVAECSLGAGMLLAFSARVAGVLGALLFVTFAVVIAVNLTRGRRFACGCGVGGQELEIGAGLVIRNLILALCATYVALAGHDHAANSHAEALPLVLTSIDCVFAIYLWPTVELAIRMRSWERSGG
jgi:hypothetical protein